MCLHYNLLKNEITFSVVMIYLRKGTVDKSKIL